VFRILLAEDNPGDVLLFREALKSRALGCDIQVAEDGQKAIALLRGAAMPDAQRLDLIVLDVNLPRSSGELVLREIRAQPSLVGIPVIMLTSSPSPDDKAMAAKMGADLFIQKSSDLDQFFEVGKLIEHLLTGKTR
jgi:CheY-like chemotaxis protein